MRRPFIAAAVQLCAGTDRAKNLAQSEALVRNAAERGAELIVLPEVFAWRGPREEERLQAETLSGATVTWLRGLARELRVHLVAGSILERAARGGRAFNTSLLVGPNGRILASYRKIHLFDVDLPGAVTVRESDTRRPGRTPVLARTPLATLGLSVCYDLRFPELYRQLTFRGATVLLVPAAFTAFTGRAHWETLLRARAIENQCFVVAPNQTGVGPTGACWGHSAIIDPWGTVLAALGDEPGVAVAALDPAELRRVRRSLPALAHVRLLKPRAAGRRSLEA